MADPIHIITERLQGVQRSGKGFKALCPAHPDRTPSLSVTEGQDGRVLLHCFAGCALVAVVQSMGLGCWRRLNLDSECQSNFDRGILASS
jgi:hypothetical protein